MATLETKVQGEIDSDLNLLLPNSALEQPLWRSVTAAVRRARMQGWPGAILMCGAALFAFGQTSLPEYQPGTITAVAPHPSPRQQESNVTQYDVSVKVGNTTYLVLFTPPTHSNAVEHWVGSDLRVLVGRSTLILNGGTSGETEAPILGRETLPPQVLDWSQACGQYFGEKLQHLSESLALTENQQAEIRPILEQENGEVTEICLNPVPSRVDKVNQYKRVVRASDEKINPVLSASQLDKLRDLRKEQKQGLEEIIAKQMSARASD
jgi:hypothetical protein